MTTQHGPGAPTLAEVARVAGVSRATASRAVNGGARVSPAAMAAVQAAVQQVGYRPNRAARSLVTRRTDSIAVVIPESDQMLFTDPFFAAVLHGVTAALASTEMQIVLLLGEERGASGRLLSYLAGSHCDGAVVVSHHREDGVAQLLAASATPSVFIGRPWEPEATPVSYVDVDNYDGGRLAAAHLLERGVRRPGTIAGPADMGGPADRLAGWRDALAAAGVEPGPVLHTDFSRDSAVQAAEQLLDRAPDVDGIFVASDLMAAATLRVLRDHGRRVPEDVRVVGFDDLDLARTAEPPLTSLVNPAGAMGRAAVAMLLEDLASPGAQVPRSRILPTELVVRASS